MVKLVKFNQVLSTKNAIDFVFLKLKNKTRKKTFFQFEIYKYEI